MNKPKFQNILLIFQPGYPNNLPTYMTQKVFEAVTGVVKLFANPEIFSNQESVRAIATIKSNAGSITGLAPFEAGQLRDYCVKTIDNLPVAKN